ncbi:MAG: GH92 family glycosyl hydrolase [Ignavibacteriaceae bacterium]
MRTKRFVNLLIIIIFIVPHLLSAQNKNSKINNILNYVNPFIGTANGGNTFPGAVVPWGMVSVSPHNSNSPSGYIYGQKYFYGFGHVHLSGTGCPDLGSIILVVQRGEVKVKPKEYRCTYSSEKASPGYYRVLLNEPGVLAEATASTRCGFIKLTPENNGELNILLDVGRSLALVGGGEINKISNTEVDGYNNSGGLCGEENREEIFFYTKFSQPCVNQGIWVNDSLISDNKAIVKDSSLGCWLTFKVIKGIPLLIKTGISYVSKKNAAQNLKKEIPGWDFDSVKSIAEKKWTGELSRIRISGGKKGDKIKFYSALYHMLIHPNIISDVNGEYPLMGRKGIGKYKDRDRYSVFSLWDTYRTLHPFLTLVYPEKESDIIKTMLDMYSESGYLPKWEIAGNEMYFMSGDPASVVISDSYIKGIKDFDIKKALEAVLKPTEIKNGESAPPIRAGYHELLHYGYIPFEQDTSQPWWVWGPASTTLEYCFDDWAISQFAKKLNDKDLFQKYYNRSMLYKNLFDTTTDFIRPKRKNGTWLTPFNPLATEGSGSWSGSGGPGYVEGDAWNYTWFVPQDIPGLISLFGGEKKFIDKLQQDFNNGQFTIGNEPDIANPYLFTYVNGEEYKTADLVQSIIRNDFGTNPDGLPGNDDCGTISGWLVFSMLGFYPVCPASEYYQLSIPSFDKITIHLNSKYYSGKKFIIEKRNGDLKSSKNIKIILNGERIKNYIIDQSQIVSGSKIQFIRYK